MSSSPQTFKMNRKGFGNRAKVREEVKDIYQSDLINQIKKEGFTKKFGRITVHLAKEFGFCYGVDRAVELAYETRQNFPEKTVYLTTEIIHNPTVNQDLVDMGIKFLSGPFKSAEIDDVSQEDVVLVPAFGTTIQELQVLHNKGCELVDTICGSVIVVWKRVEKYAKEGVTAIIHGKYYHEETQATSSQVLQYPEGRYLIVLNKDEAQYVCDYIEKGGDRDEFLKKFEMAMSPGFDPDIHLKRVGLANQTTMLASESLEIAGMFKDLMARLYGVDKLNYHYHAFDTICSATQERQDAIEEMKSQNPDLILVVGGYNSSNTAHLLKKAESYTKAYHICKSECLVDENTIKHQLFKQKEEICSKDWLPEGEFSVGITSGASTPNNVMGEVLQRLMKIAGVTP